MGFCGAWSRTGVFLESNTSTTMRIVGPVDAAMRWLRMNENQLRDLLSSGWIWNSDALEDLILGAPVLTPRFSSRQLVECNHSDKTS